MSHRNRLVKLLGVICEITDEGVPNGSQYYIDHFRAIERNFATVLLEKALQDKNFMDNLLASPKDSKKED